MNIKKQSIVCMLTALVNTLLLTACSSDSNDNLGLPDTTLQPLTFSVNAADVTRTAPVGATLEESFGVYAYVYADAWAGTEAPGYMKNEEVLYRGDNRWTTANTFANPATGQNIRMYAYTPYKATGDNAFISQQDALAGQPVLTVTVPTDISSQADFMTATFDEMTTASYLSTYLGTEPVAVPLTFKHRLTQVRFVTGSQMPTDITVKKITIKGVKNSGQLTLGTETWTLLDGTADYSVTKETFITEAGQELNDGADRLMLLPQTAAGLRIELTYNDGSRDITLPEVTIPEGNTWNAGNIVTYSLDITSMQTLSLTTTITPWNDGGTSEVGVTDSNRLRVTDGVEEWEIDGDPEMILKKIE